MERRKHQRAALAFPLRLGISDVGKFSEEFATDLSAGGIFLQMNAPLAVGTEVDLDFYLEPARKTIRARGRVVRSITEGGEGDSPPGMGIQFTDLGKDGKRFIALLIERYNKKHPSEPIEEAESFAETSEPEVHETAEVAPPPATEPEPEPEREREAARIDLDTLAQFPDEDSPRKTLAHSLQSGEIFLRSDSPRPLGTAVKLQILILAEERWVSAEGEISRAMYSGGTSQIAPGPGMAVALSNPSEKICRLLYPADESVPAVS